MAAVPHAHFPPSARLPRCGYLDCALLETELNRVFRVHFALPAGVGASQQRSARHDPWKFQFPDECLAGRIWETAALAGVPHDFIKIDRFDLQLYFAGADSAEIEQFVYQPGFELDVTLDHREIFADIWAAGRNPAPTRPRP